VLFQAVLPQMFLILIWILRLRFITVGPEKGVFQIIIYSNIRAIRFSC